MIRNKNILVLGAAGFIGTNLCLRLIKEGNKVWAFDRDSANMDIHRDLGCNVITGDLGSFSLRDDGSDILVDIDVVFHLVSTTCPTNSNIDVATEIEENVVATTRFLDMCVKYRVERIIFLSSGGTVYGKGHSGILSESDEAFPISSYGIQKLTIEKILYLYGQIHDMDYRVVRLANPYGPYQKPNGVQGVVSTFTWKAMNNETICVYGDGSVVRDYIYIDDAIEGIMNIASDDARYKLYNLGCGQGYSVNEVIEAIKEGLGCDVLVKYTPARQVDVPINILNIDRYNSDFKPIDYVGLKDGIRKLAAFYEKNI